MEFAWVWGSALLSGRIPVQGAGETVSEDSQRCHPAAVLTLSSVPIPLVTAQCFPCCRTQSLTVTLLEALNQRGVFCNALGHLPY